MNVLCYMYVCAILVLRLLRNSVSRIVGLADPIIVWADVGLADPIIVWADVGLADPIIVWADV